VKLRQTRSRAVKLGPEHAKVFGTGGLELWNKFVAGRILTIGPPQTPLPGDWKCKPSAVFRLAKTSVDRFRKISGRPPLRCPVFVCEHSIENREIK
jgi:hypothetical protein